METAISIHLLPVFQRHVSVFADGVSVRCDRKKGIKDNAKIWAQTVGRMSVKEEIRCLVVSALPGDSCHPST